MCSKVTHRTLNSWLWFIVNCNTYFRMMPFFCIHISQGSVVTCLKHGGIFKHELVANLLPSRLVKKFENRITLSEVMAKSLVSCFFWLTVYNINITDGKLFEILTGPLQLLSNWQMTWPVSTFGPHYRGILTTSSILRLVNIIQTVHAQCKLLRRLQQLTPQSLAKQKSTSFHSAKALSVHSMSTMWNDFYYFKGCHSKLDYWLL